MEGASSVPVPGLLVVPVPRLPGIFGPPPLPGIPVVPLAGPGLVAELLRHLAAAADLFLDQAIPCADPGGGGIAPPLRGGSRRLSLPPGFSGVADRSGALGVSAAMA
jgi:hypothetical protein